MSEAVPPAAAPKLEEEQQADASVVEAKNDASAAVLQAAEELEELELPSSDSEPEDVMDMIAETFMTMKTDCSDCGAEGETKLLAIDVPGMDDKLLQKFTCGVCSRTDTDEIERSTVKLLGKKFQLKLNDESQWRERIVLKSNSCVYSLPEIGLNYAKTTGPCRLTVEQLLNMTKIEIYKLPAFNGGDLGEGERKDGLLKLMSFTQDLEEVITGEREATFVIEDEGNHVSVSSPFAGEAEDPHLQVER